MPILRLPSELVLDIFGYLGAEFFREDIGRLSISAEWYKFAWPALVCDVKFTAQSFLDFMANDIALTQCQPYISTLELDFNFWKRQGFADGDGIFYVNIELGALADALHQCPRLRRLELKTAHFWPIRPAYVSYSLGKAPLIKLLSLRHLTSTPGCDLRGLEFGSGVHVYCSVNSLLPSLRHGTQSRLEEVTINMSSLDLAKRAIPDSSLSHFSAKHCQSISNIFIPLEGEMETQAVALSHRLKKARMVRVIFPESPYLTNLAFDAVTGYWVRSGNHAEWDADGESLDETESDDESEDDSEDGTDREDSGMEDTAGTSS